MARIPRGFEAQVERVYNPDPVRMQKARELAYKAYFKDAPPSVEPDTQRPKKQLGSNVDSLTPSA